MMNAVDILVVGIGNPLRGDDGVGIAVVERLGRVRPALATCVTVQQLLPELAEQVANKKLVVFVDAAVDVAPGDVILEPVWLAASSEKLTAFSHELTPAHLLALVQVAYGTEPDAWSIRIGGANFADANLLSPAIAAVIDTALQHIRELLSVAEARERASHA